MASTITDTEDLDKCYEVVSKVVQQAGDVRNQTTTFKKLNTFIH